MYQTASEFFRRVGIAFQQCVDTSMPLANGILLFDGHRRTPAIRESQNGDRGDRRVFIEGDFELLPPQVPGVSGADSEPLLLVNGMKATKRDGVTRYTSSALATFATDAYLWAVGMPVKLADCRPRLTQLGIVIGDRFKGRMSIRGDSTDIAVEELPCIALPAAIPSIATYANTACHIALPGGSPLTTWAESLVLNFEPGSMCPRWTLRLERTAKEDFDPRKFQAAGVPLVASLRLTHPERLYSEIGICGRIESIRRVVIHGGRGWEIRGRAVPKSFGDGGFYAEFGETTKAESNVA